MSEANLRSKVEQLVAQIPIGRVMTYGQLAALCGSPRAARIVGGIAHYGPTHLHTTSDCPNAQHSVPQKFSKHNIVERSSSHSTSDMDVSLRASRSPRSAFECEGCGGQMMPWHRVVNKKGGLASGYHGGRLSQKEHLEVEGVVVSGEEGQWYVDVERLLWTPQKDVRDEILDLRYGGNSAETTE